ncbi:hypothetical protein EDB19DRAFT_1827931 [Suillus lakei]|nr:hypothetical protein EDB19DRAFT_1827931 [Suillus lakei]
MSAPFPAQPHRSVAGTGVGQCYAFAWGADIIPIDVFRGSGTTKCGTHSAHINSNTSDAFTISPGAAQELSLISTHSCNGAFINLPAPGSSITAGANFTVQIGLPSVVFNNNPAHSQDTLTGTEEISIVIAIQSCPTGNCLPVSEDMGTVLYEGPFNPQFGSGADDPYEDFSVQVPVSFATGQAQLGLAHFNLIGELYWPSLQLANETVYVV